LACDQGHAIYIMDWIIRYSDLFPVLYFCSALKQLGKVGRINLHLSCSTKISRLLLQLAGKIRVSRWHKDYEKIILKI
jgi:hypothetical protein